VEVDFISGIFMIVVSNLKCSIDGDNCGLKNNGLSYCDLLQVGIGS